ncbi:MAG: NAD-dependent epimerase/dehydratase family protein [Planctomycetaceae bacterium]|nr:NAD-dependent epimerase/dehydratase family protein [Planctomycetaceae bacterium]
MPSLVTGGGGFLGRYIVEQLLAEGQSVRSLSRNTYPELEALGVEQFRGDLRNLDDVRHACEGVDTVFHVAAVPGVWGPWAKYYDINTRGTEHIIEACRMNGVRKLVFTSSPSVVFDGQSHLDADESLPYPQSYLCHYPHTKALAEQAVLAANSAELSTVSLRPHLIWGPRDNHLIPRLLDRARKGKLKQVGDGKNLISMAYVENVAAAHLQVAKVLAPDSKVAGQAYFINDPEPVNLWSWVNNLLQRAGIPPVKSRVSAAFAWTAGALCEAGYWLTRQSAEPPMTRFVALQLSQSHSYSIAKAQRDFGYEPLISAEEGFRRLEADFPSLLLCHPK